MKTMGELAELLDALLLGDPEVEVSDAKTTAKAAESDITFACSEQHWQMFMESKSKAAIVSDQISLNPSQLKGRSYLVVNDAEAEFERVVGLFRPRVERPRIGISPQATISDSAVIAEDVDIYPGAFIGDRVEIGCGSTIYPNSTIMSDSKIGANTTIFPNVVLYENTIVGARCLIHGGAVIGAFGFGYRSEKTHRLSAQLGNVVIGDDVEIGSNTTIDRGTYDSTTIGDGSKLDDLVMIGHNCQIGKHNLLCSQVGIAGSSTTGDYVVMAGQVGIGDHLHIGDNVTIAAQSGVMHNLESGKVYLGSPAIPAREQMQLHATVAKLPEMRKQMRAIEKQVRQLSDTNNVTNEAA